MPNPSSNLPETGGPRLRLCSVLLRMGFTYAPDVATRAVVSYTALPPLRRKRRGIFLLHYPWSRLHRPLAGILPCEARTFLVCGLSAPAAAITCLTHCMYLLKLGPGRKKQLLLCRQLLYAPLAPFLFCRRIGNLFQKPVCFCKLLFDPVQKHRMLIS